MDEANPLLDFRYEDTHALRKAVEKASKRSLTDAEWAAIAPTWFGPYDTGDVNELAMALSAIPKPSTPSREDQVRGQRRARAIRTALEARSMVEASREVLWGRTDPPFANRGKEASAWIEAQVDATKTKRFSIEVTVPLGLGRFESLVWLRDYLTEKLNRFPARTEDDSLHFRRFLRENDAVRNLSWAVPILEYLGLDAEGQIVRKHVYAPDGTLLGQLRNRAEELAKAANWDLSAAVHHLLTGGVAVPRPVRPTSGYRVGRKAFGVPDEITLEISDPTSVTVQDLADGLRQARGNLATFCNEPPRQRSRVASKSERVAAFVEETANLSWANRLEEWNGRNPDERFRTMSAIKESYRRATKR